MNYLSTAGLCNLCVCAFTAYQVLLRRCGVRQGPDRRLQFPTYGINFHGPCIRSFSNCVYPPSNFQCCTVVSNKMLLESKSWGHVQKSPPYLQAGCFAVAGLSEDQMYCGAIGPGTHWDQDPSPRNSKTWTAAGMSLEFGQESFLFVLFICQINTFCESLLPPPNWRNTLVQATPQLVCVLVCLITTSLFSESVVEKTIIP